MVEGRPDAGLVPVAEPAPARHARAAAHLRRQHLPRDAGAEDEEDPREGRAVGDAGASAARFGGLRWEEWLDDGPEVVGEEGLGHPIQLSAPTGGFVRRS